MVSEQFKEQEQGQQVETLPALSGPAKVIFGGRQVKEVSVKEGTPFSHIFDLIKKSGFKEVRIRTFDPQTGMPIELYTSNPPETFEPGRTYEITPYDSPGH